MNRIGVGGRCCLILVFIGIFVVMDAEPTSDPAEIAKSVSTCGPLNLTCLTKATPTEKGLSLAEQGTQLFLQKKKAMHIKSTHGCTKTVLFFTHTKRFLYILDYSS